MPRTHFYHTVLGKDSAGVVHPLEHVEARPFQVSPGTGLELPTEGIIYANRTGAEVGENISNWEGVVEFYLEFGDYNIHFRDLHVSQRIEDFIVGFNSISNDQVITLQTSIATLQTQELALAAQDVALLAADADLQSQLDALAGGTISLTSLATAVQNALVPVGAILPYGGTTAPGASGAEPWPWRLCDGSILSRTTYSALFAIIGTAYNLSTGETATSAQFRLPDLRGRTAVGVDGAAARLAADDAIGQASGAEVHTLSQAQIPDHEHHMVSANFGGPPPALIGSGGKNYVQSATAGGAASRTLRGDNPVGGFWSGIGVGSVFGSSGGSHNNMQPYQITQYMIKT
jgi:microcystin-dependent protein